MKILIQYKESSKVREVTDHQHLIEVIESSFNIQRIFFSLQIYEEDFGEYVDFEDFSSLKDKSKIKVVDLRVNTLNEISNTIQNYPSVEQQMPIIEDATDVEVVLNLKSQWPSTVQLPIDNFSGALREALDGEQDLSWKLSSELVDHLANYAYSFTRYPNKGQRIEICQSLISKFPHLKNNIGLGIGAWEVKLLNKLKKMRQNDPSLEVELNKIKRKSLTSTMPKKIKLNPEKGEVNWAPDHIEGEDDSSQSTHRQIMLEESKKANSFQDKVKIRSLMALTYSFRRSSINNKIPIQDLKDQYPIFFQVEEQFEEFERLTAINIKETFFSETASNGSKLLRIFLDRKQETLKPVQEYVLTILQSINEEEKENIKTALGLYVLPYLLKESVIKFVQIVS